MKRQKQSLLERKREVSMMLTCVGTRELERRTRVDENGIETTKF